MTSLRFVETMNGLVEIETVSKLFQFCWGDDDERADQDPNTCVLHLIKDHIQFDPQVALNDTHLQQVFANSANGVELCVWTVWHALALTLVRRLHRFALLTDGAAGVRIDSRLALLEFASEQFVRPPPTDLWDPLSGLFRCANDRFVRLHCNFPHHRRAAIALLGIDQNATRDDAIQKLATMDAFDIDRRAPQFGAVAAVARTPAEWRATSLSHTTSQIPLIEADGVECDVQDQQSNAPPRLGPSLSKPLAGVRVLDLTRVLAGPICCRTLAQYGADVVRIWHSSALDTESVLRDTSRGKRALELDLKSADGIARLRELLVDTDVIVSAFRPGVMERLGLGDAALARDFPRLIVARVTAFGDDCGLRGFDSIVQTATGMNLASTSTPRPLVFQMLDHATGLLLATAIIASLTNNNRQRRILRCSLIATANWFNSTFASDSGFKRDSTSKPVAISSIQLSDVDYVGQHLKHCITFH